MTLDMCIQRSGILALMRAENAERVALKLQYARACRLLKRTRARSNRHGDLAVVMGRLRRIGRKLGEFRIDLELVEVETR